MLLQTKLGVVPGTECHSSMGTPRLEMPYGAGQAWTINSSTIAKDKTPT